MVISYAHAAINLLLKNFLRSLINYIKLRNKNIIIEQD